jgi:type IV pilus assembly protein PilM
LAGTLYIQKWLYLEAGAYFMKMSFKNSFVLESKRDKVLGLDIGSYAVKMVQLHKEQSGFSVTAAAKVDIGTAKETDLNSADINVVKAVQECLRLSFAQAQMAVCGVSGPEVAVRRFKFPLLPRDEIHGAVMLEAAQVCPFNFGDSVVDYHVIPNGQDSIRGVLVAATSRLVQKKKWFAEEASLRTVLMDVDGLALLNCLQFCKQDQPGRKIAVLNVGGSLTTLAVVDNDNLPFIRDIAYAGSDIIGNLASRLGVESATVQKNILGAADIAGERLNIKGALPFACQKLVDDVSETLRYHSANEKNVVDDIYVSGGFALVDGFVDLLKSSFPANVRLWNPFETVPCNIPGQYADFLKKQGPAMTVAAGLAMRTI